jgi:hypothetical protein
VGREICRDIKGRALGWFRRWSVPQLTISDNDASILRELLAAKLVELRHEISHTDSHRFRDTLREVERMLHRLLEQLPKTVIVE